MYILLNLLYFQSMSSVYIFTFVSVFCFNCSAEAHLAGVPFPCSFDSRLALRQS